MKTPKRATEATRPADNQKNTEANKLSRITRKSHMRSTSCWLTESCNSQCVSHFAAPFIVVRAETSITGGCVCSCPFRHLMIWKIAGSVKNKQQQKVASELSTNPPTTLGHAQRRMKRHPHGHNATCTNMKLECVNDSSAGSPTETLLRLLLPPSDEVH